MSRAKKWRLGFGAGLLGGIACSSPADAPGPVATSVSAIQGGTTDAVDTFVVGVVQETSSSVALCSGALLAPNLVATARHCVSKLSSDVIDCSTSTFGSVLPLTDFGVTLDTQLGKTSSFTGVSKIIVPSGSDQTKVCGNDIALLILDKSIALPKYVVPVINPPMTDHGVYSTQVTVIGYGISSPTDQAGNSAGTRRIKEDVALTCIPNDPTFANCFSNPNAQQFLSANEFVSGDDSTCEGDSGSGAFEQSNFNNKNWVSFGVLSRGGVSGDGLTCVQPIYTRFDAWGSLLMQTAIEAASIGGYVAPEWAGSDGGTPADEGGLEDVNSDAMASSGSVASSGSNVTPSTGSAVGSPSGSTAGSSMTGSSGMSSSGESSLPAPSISGNDGNSGSCNGDSGCGQNANSNSASESPIGSHLGCGIASGRDRTNSHSIFAAISMLAGLSLFRRRGGRRPFAG